MTGWPQNWIVPPIDWSEGSSSREAFKGYADAFVRLLNNAPELNEDFVGIVADGGRVKVTQSNVADESGFTRSRISGKSCDYPKLAALIKSFRPSHGVNDSTTAQLAERQARIVELEQLVRVLHSTIAAVSVGKEELRLQLEEARSDLATARSRKRPGS